MNEEWLNRIALTWANKTRLRGLRQILDHHNSATEAIHAHPEWITKEAILHAQKEIDFIERHQITPFYY